MKSELREILEQLGEAYHNDYPDQKALKIATKALEALIEEQVREAYRHGYNTNSRDCLCGGVEIPHRHLMSDGESHDIRPDLIDKHTKA